MVARGKPGGESKYIFECARNGRWWIWYVKKEGEESLMEKV